MYEEQILKISDRPSYIGMIVSLPFIAINFIIYMLIPLKHGHGKQLMSFLFSLFSSYLFFAISASMEKEGRISSTTCNVLAVLTLYFTFSTFSWTSVICFDTWLTIRDVYVFWEEIPVDRRRRFWYYTAFCWNVPLVLLILIITLSKTVQLHTWYNPGLSDSNCWLNDGIPQLLYFIVPMSIGIAADIFFLAFTLYKIKTIQNEKISKTKRKKMLFKFYSRLRCLAILLINWLLDISAWALKYENGYVPNSVWYTAEASNGITGILILLSTILFDKNMRGLTAKRFLEFKAKYRSKKRYTINDTNANGC